MTPDSTLHTQNDLEFTDRCQFCLEMGYKVWPRVCADCFALALELAHAGAGWIDLNRQKPPIKTSVLLGTSDGQNGGVAMGFLRSDGTWEVDLPRGVDFEPSHWQYPPQAPKSMAVIDSQNIAGTEARQSETGSGLLSRNSR